MTETRSSVTWGWESEAGKSGRERLQKGSRRFWGSLGVFTLLIVVMVLQVDAYVKTYQIMYFKYVHFIVYQLNLCKAVSKKPIIRLLDI